MRVSLSPFYPEQSLQTIGYSSSNSVLCSLRTLTWIEVVLFAKLLCLISLRPVLKHQRLSNCRKVEVLCLIEKGFHVTTSFLSIACSSSKVGLTSPVKKS